MRTALGLARAIHDHPSLRDNRRARRLAMITPVAVPEGAGELGVRRLLLDDFDSGIEIGAVLRHHGWRAAPGAGVEAGPAHYRAADRAEVAVAERLRAGGIDRA